MSRPRKWDWSKVRDWDRPRVEIAREVFGVKEPKRWQLVAVAKAKRGQISGRKT